MSHSLPHLTVTTSTSSLSSFSSTSPIFPTVSPSQTSTMILNPKIPCDVPQQSGGSTQIPSLTCTERTHTPNTHRQQTTDTDTDTDTDTETQIQTHTFDRMEPIVAMAKLRRELERCVLAVEQSAGEHRAPRPHRGGRGGTSAIA